ncbi:MAG: hypothetical protein RL154_859 [Pseudomonadota bacterium]
MTITCPQCHYKLNAPVVVNDGNLGVEFSGANAIGVDNSIGKTVHIHNGKITDKFKPMLMAKANLNYYILIMYAIVAGSYILLDKWLKFNMSIMLEFSLLIVSFLFLVFYYKSSSIPLFVYDSGFVFGSDITVVDFVDLQKLPDIGKRRLGWLWYPNTVYIEFKNIYNVTQKLELTFKSQDEAKQFLSLWRNSQAKA